MARAFGCETLVLSVQLSSGSASPCPNARFQSLLAMVLVNCGFLGLVTHLAKFSSLLGPWWRLCERLNMGLGVTMSPGLPSLYS